MSVIQLVAYFASVDLRALVDERVAQQPNSADLSPEVLDAIYNFAVAWVAFQGLVGLALWLWMAWKNWQGRSWARVLATVFFVIGVVVFIGSLANPGSTIVLVLGIISLLAGAMSIFFIWRGDSTDYYEGVKAHRAARRAGAARP